MILASIDNPAGIYDYIGYYKVMIFLILFNLY